MDWRTARLCSSRSLQVPGAATSTSVPGQAERSRETGDGRLHERASPPEELSGLRRSRYRILGLFSCGSNGLSARTEPGRRHRIHKLHGQRSDLPARGLRELAGTGNYRSTYSFETWKPVVHRIPSECSQECEGIGVIGPRADDVRPGGGFRNPL